jgi:single-strand DNA-binding protein
MANLNRITIIGNVGKPPEMRFAPKGTPVTTFSVAVNNAYTAKATGEKITETEWFNVVTWGKLAENCNQYLTKGKSVYVEGRLKTRSWDGNDGQKKYRTEIIANQIQFLGGRPPGTTVPEDAIPQKEAGIEEGNIEPEDLPF